MPKLHKPKAVDLADDKTLVDYSTNKQAVEKVILEKFDGDDLKFEFLEQRMATNAMRAMQVFEAKAEEMTASDAAKAAVLFAAKSLDIKKAREAGFKEPPINVGIIMKLEKSLAKLA